MNNLPAQQHIMDPAAVVKDVTAGPARYATTGFEYQLTLHFADGWGCTVAITGNRANVASQLRSLAMAMEARL
jgi:hypothetical protein